MRYYRLYIKKQQSWFYKNALNDFIKAVAVRLI